MFKSALTRSVRRKESARWFRFSLRTLLITVSCVSLSMVLLSYRIGKVKWALQQIEREGGGVWYQNDVGEEMPFKVSNTNWLRISVGLESLPIVSIIEFFKFSRDHFENETPRENTSMISRNTLQKISVFPSVSGLKFYKARLHPEDLIYLEGLTNLKVLQFRCSSNARGHDLSQLDSLGKLRSLQHLTITDLPDVRGQLGFLRKLKSLQDLEIRAETLGTESLEIIGTLTQLEGLLISNILVGDSGLTHLADLKELRYLNLGKAPVAPNSIVQLEKLKKLRYLAICPTAIDDTLVTALKHFENLQYLDLSCEVVADELRLLQDSLPNCSVNEVGINTNDGIAD